MNQKHPPMTPREVMRRLSADGWVVARKGPGDHLQLKHPQRPGRVTLDAGAR